MQRFIVQRVLQSLLTLLFLSVVVFFMTWATVDPVRYIKPPEEITEEKIEALRRNLGLDRPLVVQYVVFVGRAALVGVTLGLVSGYFGSWVDALLMRLVDFMLALPGLLFTIVIVAGLGSSVRTIIIVVVATSWVAYARYVRGEVLSQRERDYVTAALATGCGGGRRIMLRHLLPNVLATVLVIATLQTGGIILLVASLSFLGLGIPKPTAAWGVMIADGRAWLLQAWWISVFPGVAISLLIISLNLVGDWMRDTFDPRLRGA